MNQKPDIARERRHVLGDPDEIAVSIPNKTGQASHTHAGPYSDQVLTDVVKFASHRTNAGDAEQPPLLRHFCEVLIEGDELPPFRRGQMSIGSVRIETEGHRSDLPRHGARFIRPHEPHGNIGVTTT